MSSANRSRARFVKAAVALVIVLVGLWACTPLRTPLSLPEELRVRRVLANGLPGFRLTKIEPVVKAKYVWVPLLELWRYYEYELESEDVPGFVVYGTYYIMRAGTPEGPAQDRNMETNLFSGKTVKHEALVDLQRMWVEAFPGKKVTVSEPGPRRVDGNREFGPRTGLPEISDVYLVNREYFHWDESAGKWEYLPDYDSKEALWGHEDDTPRGGEGKPWASTSPASVALSNLVAKEGQRAVTVQAKWSAHLMSDAGTHVMSNIPELSSEAWTNVAVVIDEQTVICGTNGETASIEEIHKPVPEGFEYYRDGVTAVTIIGVVRPLTGLISARAIVPRGREPEGLRPLRLTSRFGGLANEGKVTGAVVNVWREGAIANCVLQSDVYRSQDGAWCRDSVRLVADRDTGPFEAWPWDRWTRVVEELGDVEVTFDRDAKGRLHVVKMERAAH